MIITLNDTLQYLPPSEYQAKRWGEWRASGHKEFAESFAASWEIKEFAADKGKVVRGLIDHERTQVGFINVLADAYSRHIGLVVNPHDIWFVILANVVSLMQDNPADFRTIFIASEQKELLLVPQDHPTDINVQALTQALRQAAPVDISVFLPEFSSATPEANLAMSACVLDMARHHYDYGMFCCGIPAIDLRGTREDWIAMCTAIDRIITLIHNCGGRQTVIRPVIDYLDAALKVGSNILLSFDQDQAEFWNDIFTQNNVGSGGDLQVNGWICDLYHNVKRGSLIRSFHDAVAKVPYKNVSTGQHFLMVHGAFGSNVQDGFVTTVYDHITIEYTPK